MCVRNQYTIMLYNLVRIKKWNESVLLWYYPSIRPERTAQECNSQDSDLISVKDWVDTNRNITSDRGFKNMHRPYMSSGICVSHGGEDVDCGLLGCDSVWSPPWRWTRNVLRNVGNQIHTATDLIRLQSTCVDLIVILQYSTGVQVSKNCDCIWINTSYEIIRN
jgi:hypothetical protein